MSVADFHIIDVMTMTDTAAFGGMTADEAKALAIRSMQIMVDGRRDDFDAVVHPDAINREGKDEPPESRGRGPAAFYATALWLRAWFDDLAFEIHDVIVEGDLVVGAQHDVRPPDRLRRCSTARTVASLQVMPATGKPFATTQTHWLRLRDGKVIEHWANRDDQGTAMQLGWIPPTPWFLLKSAMATRRARRREATRPRYE